MSTGSHLSDMLPPAGRNSPGDVEGLPAALPVAGHAGPAGRLALPPVVIADVTSLDGRAEAGNTDTSVIITVMNASCGAASVYGWGMAAERPNTLEAPRLRVITSSEDEIYRTEQLLLWFCSTELRTRCLWKLDRIDFRYLRFKISPFSRRFDEEMT